MQGNRKPEGSSQAKPGRNLSLESLLQQAWLQSQRPKVQRRTNELGSPVDAPSAAERASSQSSSSQSPVPERLSGADSGFTRDVEGSEETYPHKTMPGALSAEYLERFAQPELSYFSQKVNVKKSSSSTLTRARPAVSDGSSQGSVDSTSKFNSTADFPGASTLPALDDAADFEGLRDFFSDWTGETDTSDRDFFEELLTNEENLEAERSPVRGTAADHDMEKEIVDLLLQVPEGADGERGWSVAEFLLNEDVEGMVDTSSAYRDMAEEIGNLLSSEPTVPERSEAPNQASSSRLEVAPSDHEMTLKCMDGFTNMFSKHLQDVSTIDSDSVDITKWTTEDDEIQSQFDERWTPFLDRLKISLETSTLDKESNVHSPTDMRELLYSCAFAVSRGDANAGRYLAELRDHSSAFGNFMERMAHYYHEALVAKMSGTGETLYTVLKNNHPSGSTMVRSHRLYIDNSPYIKVKHLIAQGSILDAFEGATHVHLIHYGIQMGVEHAGLIHNLSMRPGGPPHFRLTGIEFPHPGDDPLMKLHETGRRLEEFAKRWGVPFEYHALAGSNWELFSARDFDLRKEEVLAVCSYKMHLVPDEGVLGASPRELLLRRIRSLNPKLFSLYVDNAAFTAPFFMTRFRESVKHYAAIYEGVDIAMAPDAPERVIIEREVFGREILNIAACEGQARVERAEPYRQWQNRMDRADFAHRPMKASIRAKVKSMMASFHKDFGVGTDDGWILLGLRNQVVAAASVWEPKHVFRVRPLKTPHLHPRQQRL